MDAIRDRALKRRHAQNVQESPLTLAKCRRPHSRHSTRSPSLQRLIIEEFTSQKKCQQAWKEQQRVAMFRCHPWLCPKLDEHLDVAAGEADVSKETDQKMRNDHVGSVAENDARCSIELSAEPRGESAQRNSETKGRLARNRRSK